MPACLPAPPELAWFKSSYSGANTTECVECAHVTHGVLIRDSKDADGSVVSVKTGAWRFFVEGLRQAHPTVSA
ncbi:DUF397 domain-containing protein [Streptomyces capillispiralis]|uniref:Uncharacterized protein DUF397 n=1 Tax=Streptomyces capillispiralis TaxID=68182 RepID=A0A561TJD7_9ACTN|nr:DUF397 domain-containing protein [Streptomyces capillispiralis]TWF87248.1 uncharacterized protein DUF397 [Streptomyces capillispiralis]GHH96053.1 hypothetical protein GCM10017779_65100 [Streptomyces capillispiralis]